MSALKDLTGKKFGSLTVISRYHENTKQGRAQWLCRCDCGSESIIMGGNLSQGKVLRCRKCATIATAEKNTKHGGCGSRIYKIYRCMLSRCMNPNNYNYRHYGERGITVADEWIGEDGFERFRMWSFENGYKDDLTIERKDVEKGYSPENCEWIPKWKQSYNTRRNRRYIVFGETKILSELSKEYNVNYHTLISRLDTGKDIYDALGIKKGE